MSARPNAQASAKRKNKHLPANLMFEINKKTPEDQTREFLFEKISF